MSARRRTACARAAILLLAIGLPAHAADFAALCADRVAIERVYYSHRLGTKPPFEQAMPYASIERLVGEDLHKEAVLAKVYGVMITPAMLAAEIERIDATTHAPDVLAELKSALGNEGDRFARSVAKPVVVERELRIHFDDDQQLHAPQRRDADRARESALAARPAGVDAQVAALSTTSAGAIAQVKWQLGPRLAQPAKESSPPVSGASPPPVQALAKSGNYSVQATTQRAQVIATRERSASDDDRLWFDDLDPGLQQVLRAQLQAPGDVSAVIETPGGFLVFVAREKAAVNLSAASLSIRKRSYEEWLAAQP